jgi:hypothetical protein
MEVLEAPGPFNSDIAGSGNGNGWRVRRKGRIQGIKEGKE